jgi:hypothetical protein
MRALGPLRYFLLRQLISHDTIRGMPGKPIYVRADETELAIIRAEQERLSAQQGGAPISEPVAVLSLVRRAGLASASAPITVDTIRKIVREEVAPLKKK